MTSSTSSQQILQFYVPECPPSPRGVWIDLVDAESLGAGWIPEVPPSPMNLWIDLRDEPNPLESSILEGDPIGLRIHKIDGVQLPAEDDDSLNPVGVRTFRDHLELLILHKATLEELCLVRLSLTRDSALRLSDILRDLTSLKSLTLEDIFFNVISASDKEFMLGTICDALSPRTTPLSLEFSTIKIYASFLPFLLSNTCLASLTLRSTEFDAGMFDNICMNLVGWARSLTSKGIELPLQGLLFTSCNLGASSLDSLIGVLSAHPQLRKVDLADNALGGSVLTRLVEKLSTCTQLTELNISNNAAQSGAHEGDPHAGDVLAAIGQGLSSWPFLRILKLSGFPLSTAGTMGWVSSFQHLEEPKLEVLAVSGIDSKAAQLLKQLLRGTSLRLKHLDISPSPLISDEDVAELEDILKSFNSGATLSVGNESEEDLDAVFASM